MTIPHLLVAGIVEVIFIVAIFAFIKKVSPGTIYEGAKQKTKGNIRIDCGGSFVSRRLAFLQPTRPGENGERMK